MKSFDQLLHADIADYEGRHDDLIYQAPAFYRLLTHLLDDPRLPRKLRPLVLAAIAYFILPVDIIPEELEGPYGYVDDIWLCAFVAQRVMQEIGTQEILETHWDGEGDVVQLVEEILNQENILSKDQCERVLQYIGYDYQETGMQ
ncbi:MAG: YkvA family protein [Anaerolineales bacterium]